MSFEVEGAVAGNEGRIVNKDGERGGEHNKGDAERRGGGDGREINSDCGGLYILGSMIEQ